MKPEDIIKEINTFSKDEQLMSTMSLTAAMLCCSDGTVDEAEIKKVEKLGANINVSQNNPGSTDQERRITSKTASASGNAQRRFSMSFF